MIDYSILLVYFLSDHAFSLLFISNEFHCLSIDAIDSRKFSQNFKSKLNFIKVNLKFISNKVYNFN